MLILFKKSRIIDTVDDIVRLALAKIEKTKTTRSISPAFQVHLTQILFFLVQINNGKNPKLLFIDHDFPSNFEHTYPIINLIIPSFYAITSS